VVVKDIVTGFVHCLCGRYCSVWVLGSTSVPVVLQPTLNRITHIVHDVSAFSLCSSVLKFCLCVSLTLNVVPAPHLLVELLLCFSTHYTSFWNSDNSYPHCLCKKDFELRLLCTWYDV